MICVLVASLAANAGTLRDAHVFAAGSVVEDVAVAPDGRTFAFVESGEDKLWVVRTDTWKAYPAQSCTGVVGLGAYQNGYAVGCDDGSVAFVDTSLRKPGPNPEVVPAVAGTPILGVTADSTNVYVIAENEKSGGNPQVIAVAIEGRQPLEGGWPATLGFPDYVDSETDGQYVLVSHGSDNVSKVDVSTGAVSTTASGISGAECKDVDADELSVLLACGNGIAEFEPGTNDLQFALGFDGKWSNLSSLWIDEQEDELWFFDSQAGLFVYGYDATNGVVTDDQVGAVPGPYESSEMAGVPGYAFLGTDDGEVHVYTQLPWVQVEEISEPVINGQDVNITFTSDIEGDYRVMFGEAELGAGPVLADEPVTLTITITDAFIEGENIVMVSVIDAQGDEGHGGTSINVNNPPSQVVLQEGDLGWGDATLFLTFSGIDDEDLKSYRVYWSPTEFEPGPGQPPGSQTRDVLSKPGETVNVELVGLTNEVTYYVAVRAIDATDQEGPMSIVLSGTPHETFSAAELAGDEGGYSCGSTRSRAPIALLIAVGLAALGRRGAVAALALLAFGGIARAQDEESDDTSTETTETSTETETTETSTETTETPAETTSTTTPTPPPTTASPTAPPPPVVEEPATDSMPIVTSGPPPEPKPLFHAGIELRFGPIWYEEGNPLTDVYGTSGNNLLMFEGGPSYRDIIQLEFGLGRHHRKGNLVAEDGSQSNDESVINMFPLTLGLKLRLDFLEEQWVVPTVAAGADYWLWNEKAGYNSDTSTWDEKNSGGHYGYHYAGGLQILLDAFEPRRASQLEARAGIEDSYVVVEYRHREVGEQEEGLKFTGDEFTVGLRINY